MPVQVLAGSVSLASIRGKPWLCCELVCIILLGMFNKRAIYIVNTAFIFNIVENVLVLNVAHGMAGRIGLNNWFSSYTCSLVFSTVQYGVLISTLARHCYMSIHCQLVGQVQNALATISQLVLYWYTCKSLTRISCTQHCTVWWSCFITTQCASHALSIKVHFKDGISVSYNPVEVFTTHAGSGWQAGRLVQLPSKIHPINLLLAIALIFFIILNTSSLTNNHNISLHLPVYGVYGLFITHHYERHTLGLLVIMGAWLLSRMGFTQTLFQIQPTLHRNEIRMFSFQP